MVGEKKTQTEEQPAKTGLRPAQVIAAALAAVLAAFLGSTLGVYGTVLGAGVFSVVFTVGSELFLRSLDRTRKAARALSDVKGRFPGRHAGSERGRDSELPLSEQPTQPAVPEPDTGAESQEQEEGSGKQWWKRRWPLILGTSAIAFVIGMVLITGYEGVTGKSLSGEGATTVTRIVGGGAGQPGQDEQDQPDEQEGTQSPSVTDEQESDTTETSPTEGSTTTTKTGESTTRTRPTEQPREPAPNPEEAPAPSG